MRAQLGCLTFILSVGFAAGAILSVVGNAWFSVSDYQGMIGFFGFGIPMIAAGFETVALWSNDTRLLQILGWTSTITGLACGVCLFILVAGLVLTNQPNPNTPMPSARNTANEFFHYLQFGVSMVVCGTFGIHLLLVSGRRD